MRALLRRFQTWYWGFAVVLAATLAAFLVVRTYEERRVAADFHTEAVERIDRFEGGVDNALDRLKAVGAYVDAAGNLDRARFARLTRTFTENGSPIKALEWVPRVAEAQRGAYIAAARRDGFAGFDFTERNFQGALTPASRRHEYFPIFFLEPFEGNEKALGYDVMSDDTRRKTLEQAALAGSAYATSRLTLVQGGSDGYGVLVARPVYEGGVVPEQPEQRLARINGYVLAVFRINEIVAAGEIDNGPVVWLALFDNDAPKGSHLLHPRALDIDSVDALPSGLRVSEDLRFAGHSWTLLAMPGPGAYTPNRGASTSILVLGVLIAALAAAYLRQMHVRQSAIEMAIEVSTRDLQRERNFSNAVFSSAGAVILVLDRDGRVVRFNTAAETFTGYSFSDIQDQPYAWLRFLPADQRESAREAFAQFLGGSAPGRFQSTWINSGGKTRTMDWSNSVMVDENGDPQYLVAIGVDITHQQLLERDARQQEEWLRTIIDHLGEGVYTLDESGQLSYINSQAEAMLGWTFEEMRGQSVHDLIHHHRRDGSPLPADDCPIYKAMHDCEIYRSNDEVFFHRDGTALPVKVSGAPLMRAGARIGAVVMFSDMRTQMLLQQRLVEAKESAEQAARLKSDFLSTMSHEIRTPLNGVMGMADLLFDTRLDDDQVEYVRIIKTSADALRAIIDDILDFSKIEAGRLELECTDFSLRKVVQNSIDILAAKAREAGVTLESNIDPLLPDHFNGDPVRIRQVLLNFLSNAIKFTRHGEIRLRAEAASLGPSAEPRIGVRLSVRDTGIGISEEAQERLFQAFIQADSSTTRQFGGTGLGLAICRRLAEAMGGEIGVQSAPGKGSTFWISVPLRPGRAPMAAGPGAMPVPPVEESAVAQAPAPAALKGQAPKPLLLAEDNAINQRVATLVLNKLGYEVEVVDNGAAAVREAATGRYALVLMDCQMPEMDGFEATAAIRRAERDSGAHLPIVAMTANAIEGDRERCIAAGMDDYIPKPINAARLRDVLAIWIVSAKAQAADAVEPESAPQPSAPLLPAVDMARLNDLFDGDRDAIVELLAVFRASMKKIQGSIAGEVLAHGDKLAELAHEVRGMSGNLGAQGLAELATRCEIAANDGDWAKVDVLSPALEHEMGRVLAFVEDYINA